MSFRVQSWCFSPFRWHQNHWNNTIISCDVHSEFLAWPICSRGGGGALWPIGSQTRGPTGMLRLHFYVPFTRNWDVGPSLFGEILVKFCIQEEMSSWMSSLTTSCPPPHTHIATLGDSADVKTPQALCLLPVCAGLCKITVCLANIETLQQIQHKASCKNRQQGLHQSNSVAYFWGQRGEEEGGAWSVWSGCRGLSLQNCLSIGAASVSSPSHQTGAWQRGGGAWERGSKVKLMPWMFDSSGPHCWRPWLIVKVQSSKRGAE